MTLPINRVGVMNHVLRRSCAIFTAVVVAAAIAMSTSTASALPPRCNDGSEASCPDPTDRPGHEDGPAAPEPQAEPPPPFGRPAEFNYANFALAADATIIAGLGAPPPPTEAKPWPMQLVPVPFVPELKDVPVRVSQVPGTTDVWAFASLDGGSGHLLRRRVLGYARTLPQHQ